MSSILHKATSLTWGERWMVLRIWLMLPAIWVGLRVFSLPRLLRVLDPGGNPDQTGDAGETLEAALRVARVVQGAASVLPFPSSCLSRSAVLFRLLRRRGIPAEIRLGVLNGEDGFAAHAWVEVDGQPVNDATALGQSFAPFAGELMPRR